MTPLTKPNGGGDAPNSHDVAISGVSNAPLVRITIPGLPKSMNQLMGAHWTIRAGHAKKWRRAVWKACWHLRPEKPLERAMLKCVRFSSAKEMDDDNLRSTFKPLIDGLKEAGWIVDDGPRVIGKPDVRHEKAPPGKGYVVIEIFRFEAITQTEEGK